MNFLLKTTEGVSIELLDSMARNNIQEWKDSIFCDDEEATKIDSMSDEEKRTAFTTIIKFGTAGLSDVVRVPWTEGTDVSCLLCSGVLSLTESDSESLDCTVESLTFGDSGDVCKLTVCEEGGHFNLSSENRKSVCKAVCCASTCNTDFH